MTLCPWFWPRLSLDNCQCQRIQVLVLVRRKVPAISWLSALNRRLCNHFSSYHWHLIWLNSGVALCIHHSFFNFSLSLSLSPRFESVPRLSLHRRRHSSLSRHLQSVLKKQKRKENTWQCVHTLFSSAYSDPFRLIWDLNCKVNQGKKNGWKISHLFRFVK